LKKPRRRGEEKGAAMMTQKELDGTIDWLKEFVHRVKDREDGDVLKEVIEPLEQSIRELEERKKR
jgi:hypothetical protein